MTVDIHIPPRPARFTANAIGKALSKAPPTASIGCAIITVYLVVAIFAPLIAPYHESEVVSDQAFANWSSEFLLGTDQLGRDMFSRLVYGARNTMGLAIATTLLSFFTGATLGILAANFGGWFDQVLSRLVDTMMSVPSVISALILLSIFGSSLVNLVVIIALLDSTRVFRLTRAVAINITVTDFVEAARLRGEKTYWILRREILPNIAPTLVAEFGLRFCFVFLSISALSFLGIGIQPPMADWGSMVRENATLISYGDITPLLPAGAIALLTIAVNFVVDWFLDISSGMRDE